MQQWNRKSCVCHICGVITKRFSDHILMVHGMKDHKTQRAIRDERDHTVSAKSFMTNVEIKQGLEEIEVPVDGRYSLDAFISFGTTRGWVITVLPQDDTSATATKNQSMPSTSAVGNQTKATLSTRSASATSSEQPLQPTSGNQNITDIIFEMYLIVYNMHFSTCE